MPYSYSKKMVAFVDILGFRNKTNKGKLEKQPVHDTLTTIRDLVKAYEQTNFYDCIPEYKDKIKYYTFSDSMLFSSTTDTFYTMVSAIAYLQFVCATKGFFLRGGISYGEIFDEDAFFYGKALNQAYELESKTACYPRVIISPSLNKDIETNNFLNLKENQFLKDFDGCYYINFLSKVAQDTPNMSLPINKIDYSLKDYEDIEKHIDNEFKEATKSTDSNLIIKFNWLKGYLKKFKEENSSLF